ncbi:MAG: peptidylprolyl isomerase [Candidatus Bathyarchaeia archaeon]
MSSRPHRRVKASTIRSKSRNKKLIVFGVLAAIIVLVSVFFLLGQAGLFSAGGTKVLLQTSMGDITIKLRNDMPLTTRNFVTLVQSGVYDGTIFHRVIKDFMIQGGAVNESIPSILDEFGANNHNTRGTVAMAKTSQPNSASSQFFINVVDNSNRYETFDTTYSVFGDVTSGMDVVDAIAYLPVGENDRPLMDVTVTKATVLP